jgi:cyclopropane fatty-acyl-phospholipid synthase-like methyltransferase
MLDAIQQAFQTSDYNFLVTAHPADPRRSDFPAWVDYYRLKWAIARVLQPTSILEIGVRYGYSAHAFLTACPTSTYLGIDLDSDVAGGVVGAIDWAKKIMRPFSANFLVADTQAMLQFPGDRYDFVHVDGQQDGDSSFHDLGLALVQGNYVLVDGYHWTPQNFFAVNDFLLQHRDRLDWYGVIPGYGGELLIKVKTPVKSPVKSPVITSSLDLQDTYDRTYYTQSCQGYESFATHGGQRLADDRLTAVVTLAGLKRSGRVLDLGCGRGELAYYFAQQGFEVTAVDYSPAAIDLARSCFADAPELASRVTFHCADIGQLALPAQHYDLAIATDVIEHLSPIEVQALYDRVKTWLKPDGLLILHSFPNRWYYQYDYARKRRLARRLGAYLPMQPRSWDEQRMHINEQSPRILQHQLQQTFPQVQVWFSGSGSNAIGGSLVEHFDHRALAAAPSLYAIAGNQADRSAILALLTSYPLPLAARRKPWRRWQKLTLRSQQLAITLIHAPVQAIVGAHFEIQVQLQNTSVHILHSGGAYPVNWAFRWIHPDGRTIEGDRTPLMPPSWPDPAKTNHPIPYAAPTYFVRIIAPSDPSQWTLRVTLVQEHVAWFDGPPLHLFCDMLILIIEADRA